MIKGIVFDLDGVLVDAVEWHYRALNRALSLFGYEIKPKEHASLYNGLPTAVKLEMLTQRRGLSRSLHSFVNDMKQQYTRQIIASNCRPNVELSGMLRHLRAQGYRLAVASNCIRSSVEGMLDKMAIREHFDVILSNEDVKHAKPSPEIYLKAFEMLDLQPEECVIIEDSPPGIQAARQATNNVVIVSGPEEVTLDLVKSNIQSFEESLSRVEVEEMSNSGMNPIEIIIPMAGLGQRFRAAGFKKPKPLIDIFGKPMIQWVVENIAPKKRPYHFTFICNKEHLQEYQLEDFLRSLSPDCSVIPVPGVTEGAACTVLLAKEHMKSNRPLLIANSDQWVDVNIDDFIDAAENEERDGLIMTFPATEKKWSYARTSPDYRVVQVAEKNPISSHATVGIYYYRQGKFFVDGAESMIQKDIRTNGEFYVCPVYNEMIQKNLDIRIHEISRSQMHGLGTPEDLERFLNRKSDLDKRTTEEKTVSAA